MTWAVLLVLAFSASLLITGLTRRYALRAGLIDHPNRRSSHSVPTPRGGGLSIVLVFILATLACAALGLVAPPAAFSLAAGGSLVAGVGLWDDRGHVTAGRRLATHFSAIAVAMLLWGQLPSLQFASVLVPGWVTTGLVLLSGAWLVNLYNFMDGIDGIAGVEAVTVCAVAAALAWLNGEAGLAGWILTLAAAAAGFLVWNWPPARIFMGDVGSGFVGFSLFALALVSTSIGAVSTWSWLILLGVFVCDSTLTLLVRVFRGERVHVAHRSHAYQRLAVRTGSHARVSLGVALVNVLWLAPMAWLAQEWTRLGPLLAVLAYLPLIGAALLVGAGRSDPLRQEDESAPSPGTDRPLD